MTSRVCEYCGGKGYKITKLGRKPCDRCNGTGYITETISMPEAKDWKPENWKP